MKTDNPDEKNKKANPKLSLFFGIWKDKEFEKQIKDLEKIKEKDKEIFVKKTSELGSR